MTMPKEDLLEEAARRLSAVAPEADVIVFGSGGKSNSRAAGDLDLLIIEPDFERRGDEYARLRKELRGLGVAVDLVIYRQREAEKWSKMPGSFLHQALREGHVLAGARCSKRFEG